MVAKLALVLLVLAVFLAVTVALAFKYFDNQAERSHEKDMERLERDEKLFGIADDQTGIDAQLEREREREQ